MVHGKVITENSRAPCLIISEAIMISCYQFAPHAEAFPHSQAPQSPYISTALETFTKVTVNFYSSDYLIFLYRPNIDINIYTICCDRIT